MSNYPTDDEVQLVAHLLTARDPHRLEIDMAVKCLRKLLSDRDYLRQRSALLDQFAARISQTLGDEPRQISSMEMLPLIERACDAIKEGLEQPTGLVMCPDCYMVHSE